MSDITGLSGYVYTINDMVFNGHCNYSEASGNLAIYSNKVINSLDYYLETIDDMRGRGTDIDRVMSIVSDHLTGKELINTTALLSILKDLSTGGTLDTREISEMLSRIKACTKVIKYKGYYPIRYKSDIARTYMETFYKTHALATSKPFTPLKIQVASKKSLETLTERVLNDINAYIEVKTHITDLVDEVDTVLAITSNTKVFDKIDTLLRLLHNVTTVNTLTGKEIVHILTRLEASREVIMYTNY